MSFSSAWWRFTSCLVLSLLAAESHAELVAGEGEYLYWEVTFSTAKNSAWCPEKTDGSQFATHQEAIDACAAYYYTFTYTYSSFTCYLEKQGVSYNAAGTGQADSASETIRAYYDTGGNTYGCGSHGPFQISVTQRKTTGTPPWIPEDCDPAEAGQRYWDIVDITTDPGPNGTGPQYVCDLESGCRAGAVSSSCLNLTTCSVTYEILNENCATGEPDDDFVPEPEQSAPEICIANAGNNWCNQKTDTNCGYLNNQWICAETVNSGECVQFADGAAFCGADAVPPAAPDSGTRSDPATPDAVVTTDDGDTFNYFNSTTVANSSQPIDGSAYEGTTQGGAGNGDCTGPDCGTGSASASGGETCASPPSCDGDPVGCAILAAEWRTRCEAEVDSDSLEGYFTAEEWAGDRSALDPDGGATDVTTMVTDNMPAAWWGSRASCVSDIDLDLTGFTPFGQVLTIPFSEWCALLQLLGRLFVALAWLQAGRMIWTM